MFTGIIEDLGEVLSLTKEGSSLRLRVKSAISSELKIDQSLSHNGVCLTVVARDENWHEIQLVKETLDRSNLGQLEVGSPINLERAMRLGDRLDGHMVQGHVDLTALCKKVMALDGSWTYEFSFQPALASHVLVDKGSICINGVSLTVVNPKNDSFGVAIIPYTHEHTTFKDLREGDSVNLEFDVIGKYVEKMMGGAYRAI